MPLSLRPRRNRRAPAAALRRHRLARAVRCQLEQLETRTLLANWINPAGGNFFDPGNWDTNTVPGPGDAANITLAGTYTVTMTGGSASVQSLTVGGGSGARTFVINGGSFSIDGASTVAANGALTLTNATLSGAGTLTNTLGRTLTLQNGTVSAALVNQGILLSRGGSDAVNGGLSTATGSVIRVQGNATYGSATLTVASSFSSNGNVDLNSVDGAFDSTLAVTSGTLTTASGTFLTTNAGTGGTRRIHAQLAQGGTLNVQAPTVIQKASASHVATGSINLGNGDLTVTQSGSNPSFTVATTLNVGVGRTLTVTGAPLTLAAGTLTGSGTVNATVTNTGGAVAPIRGGNGLMFFYEPFSYAAGSQLRGQGGWVEPGYNDPWSSDYQTPEIVQDAPNSATGSLGFSTLLTSGRSVLTSGVYSYDSLNFGSSFIGGSSGTYWFSFLIRQESIGNGGTLGADYGGLVLGTGNNTVFIGKPGGGAGLNNWALETANSTQQSASSVPATLGTTAFLVARVQFQNGLDTVTLFVNPTPGTSDASLVPAAQLNVELFSFNQIAISTGANAKWTFDELRIGTTFGDVAPRAAGLLTLNGNYAQGSSGTFAVDLFGNNPGVQYDQLVVNGTVSLAGSLLINAQLTPASGQTWKIIDNDGTDPIVGTFTGMPEGHVTFFNGKAYRISYVGGDGNDVTLTYPAGLSISDTSVVEGTGGTRTATFTVTRSDADNKTVSVQWSTINGTAQAGSDYQPASGTLSFGPFVTTRTISVTILSDSLHENDEIFGVYLINPVGTQIADNLGVCTIIDDDPAPTISINDVTVNENDIFGTVEATFTVTLSTISARTISVIAETADGTAVGGVQIPGMDYEPLLRRVVTFNPGETSKTFTVVVYGDELNEDTEHFFVNLSSAINGTIARGQGIATILDNDPLPSITIGDAAEREGTGGSTPLSFGVYLSAPSGRNVTLNYATADGTAVAPGDYTARSGQLTFLPGETFKTITIDLFGDAEHEPDEQFFLNLSNAVNATFNNVQAVGTIVNDDDVNGPPSIYVDDVSVIEGDSGTVNAVFTITLAEPSVNDITVTYATADGTATGGVDYVAIPPTQITIPSGQLSATVTVLINGDVTDEWDETFFLNLSNAVNGTIADDQGIGTILDDDPEPALSVNNVTVTEGNSGTVAATFTVTLLAPSGKTVTVNYATANGSAVAPVDFAGKTGQLIFLPGETSHTVTINVNGDSIDEEDETFFLNLSGAVNATIADAQGVGTILDDDLPPTISIDDVAVLEGNAATRTAIFTVTLSLPSGKPITVDYATADGTAVAPGDYEAILPSQLTFLPGENSKTITVIVNGDTQFEPDEVFYVNLFSPTNATLAKAQGEGTIQNDDVPGPVTASVAPIAPDPRQAPLPSIQITFSEAVTGFDLGDLTLTREGQTISLAGASLSTTDNVTWTLSGLTNLTGRAGSYALTLTAEGSGILGQASQPLEGDAGRAWGMNALLGTAGNDTFTLIYNPATEQFDVVTSHPIYGSYSLDLAALPSLVIEGGTGNDLLEIDLSGAPPLPAGGITFIAGGESKDALQIFASSSDAFTFDGDGVTRSDGASLHFSGLRDVVLSGGNFDVTADLAGFALTVEQGANVTLAATQHLDALTIGAGSTVTLSTGGDKVLVTKALAISGLLDLTDNSLILDYSSVSPIGTWNGSAYDGLAGLLALGYNEGDWAGTTGIRTSAAVSGYTGLGIASSMDALGLSGSETDLWNGQTVDASCVLIKFTYAGDANLDGVLNIDDYGQIDFNTGLSGTVFGYFNGDFNFDGLINIDDYGLIDFVIGIQGPPL